MPPKKEALDPNYWRTYIENIPLNEKNWKVKVILLEAAGSDQDRLYLNKFETFATEEKRFVIKNICKTETIFMVNQLGGEKKVKDENLRVFEEAQAYLKEKKVIPSEVLALIIKHLILKMKEEYLFIKKQKLVIKEGVRRESLTMLDKIVVKEVGQGGPIEINDNISLNKGQAKKGVYESSPIEPNEGKKYNTLLRVRGEEWRDKTYVDDFPSDGPDLYVSISGFCDPKLPICLLKINVPLTAIVQIRISLETVKIPSSLLRPTKRRQSQTEILAERSLKFWDDLQQLRTNRAYAGNFKNTAFMIFSPPYWDSQKLSGNPDKIYDELCYLMFDIQDLTRQHCHYLENMDVINIPVNSLDEGMLKHYNQQLCDMPLECTSIYSVLDSVLRTVCKPQLSKETSCTSLTEALTLNNESLKYDKVKKSEHVINNVFNTLCKIDAKKKKYRVNYGKEYEIHKDPIIIKHGDFVKYSTFHLGNINLDNIVWTTLLGMPVNKLWTRQERPNGQLEAKINFHINVVLSCFDRTDVETAELKRLLHILACRKLYSNRSSLKSQMIQPVSISHFKKRYLKRSSFAEPLATCPILLTSSSSESLSFPSMRKSENSSSSSSNYSENGDAKYLFECPDLSELVSSTEISNNSPVNHLIDDFEYFEDFSKISSQQVLLEVFNKFSCIDYKYCEITDCLILMFHDRHDKNGISFEEWRAHITTPLCLQDFFDFDLEENYDWIQCEEKIYDDTMLMKNKSSSKSVIEPFGFNTCIGETDVAMDLLMEGSLKFQEIISVDINSTQTSETRMTTSDKKPISERTELESKCSKKSKSPIIASGKRKHSFVALETTSKESFKIPTKPFTGYNLSDRRFEVSGKDEIFFSQDGTVVKSQYSLFIPLNEEFLTLSVISGNGNNEFWIHKPLSDSNYIKTTDICMSFRVITKDQVIINIKEANQIPFHSVSSFYQQTVQRKSSSAKSSQTMQPNFQSKPFDSFVITCPNGLITESIHEVNSASISHIKQFYVSPLPNLDEDIRCISRNGEVIIFRSSGKVQVLLPDSTCYEIDDYEKRIIIPDMSEDIKSDIKSNQDKKLKAKSKEEKSSKLSSKTSKNILSNEEKLSEINKVESELIINQFEIIEPSGIKKIYTGGVFKILENLLIKTATDYNLGEVFTKRMDGTTILLNKDGAQVVTFPNNTRIITNVVIEDELVYSEWIENDKSPYYVNDSQSIDILTLNSKTSESQESARDTYCPSVHSAPSEKNEEKLTSTHSEGFISVYLKYTIEHPNFTTISVNQATGEIEVLAPNNTSVICDRENKYQLNLDPVTTAKYDDGLLSIEYKACLECSSRTTCTIRVRSEETAENSKSEYWAKISDSFCKEVIIDNEGCIKLSKQSSEENFHPQEGDANLNISDFENNIRTAKHSDTSLYTHGKCGNIYQAKSVRFFVLQRDLSCSELIHRTLVDQYKSSCRWQPWCSITEHETFGDHRSLVSILTPIFLTESEKWLMDSVLAGKPKNLTYKDLKPDAGKGFYHWMRPYKRFEPKPIKPVNVLSHRLPLAFIERTLERQWKECERESLKGAKELVRAILQYRKLMESDCQTLLNIPIVDNRTEEARRAYDAIQDLGHRVYEDLKRRLADDVENRKVATITTDPKPENKESVSEKLEEETEEEYETKEKRRERVLKEVESIVPISPSLKRYWRQRMEEAKEEQFYRYLLREGSVPPYFRNVLGGAIWWEVNNTVDEASVKAERRKMKCACAEDSNSAANHDNQPTHS